MLHKGQMIYGTAMVMIRWNLSGIHGVVDGFSRKVLWLAVVKSRTIQLFQPLCIYVQLKNMVFVPLF